MDIDVFPNSIEYWGPTGMILYRNVQARWTPWENDAGSRFAVSFERPGASGDGGQFEDRVELVDVQGDFELPDLAAHFRWVDDWGHVQAAGILRRIAWNDLSPDGFDLSGSATGWGLNLSTNVKFGPHVLRGSVVFGEGIQNYMNDASVDIGVRPDFDNPVAPINGAPIPVVAVTAFMDLNWNDKWTSTIGFSMQDNDLPDGQAENDFTKGFYALANLLWRPVPNVMVGAELQWAERENFTDGFTSNDFRVQFSAKYNFSATLLGGG
jgi:hypothetical protein